MIKVHQIEPLGIPADEQRRYADMLAAAGFELRAWDDRPADASEVIRRCADAQVVIASNIPFGADTLAALPSLRMLAVAFAGVDHVDIEACEKQGIKVTNAAGYSTHSVAEQTLGMMLALLRDFVPNHNKTLAGCGRDGYVGSELREKTVGIIGLGRIGAEVARLCLAFGCRVQAWSRTPKEIPGVTFTQFDHLLGTSDIVSLHVPLTSDTRGLLGARQLARMRRGAFLVNTARGPVVDSQALADALETGALAGAALDVYDMEPPLPEGYPLLTSPHALLLPHTAYATTDAFARRARIVFDNILSFGNELNA